MQKPYNTPKKFEKQGEIIGRTELTDEETLVF